MVIFLRSYEKTTSRTTVLVCRYVIQKECRTEHMETGRRKSSLLLLQDGAFVYKVTSSVSVYDIIILTHDVTQMGG